MGAISKIVSGATSNITNKVAENLTAAPVAAINARNEQAAADKSLADQATAQAKSLETDKARLASGAQDLMNKRVYDLARVRNRAAGYQAPSLGGDMTGARKTLLGQ